MSETTTKTPVEQEESEFGRGLCYCLGLFLAHAERLRESPYSRDASLWFNGAADHLFSLEVESGPTAEIRERLQSLQSKSLYWRLNPATDEDAEWAIQEAKDLLRLIDAAHGVPTCKGDWE